MAHYKGEKFTGNHKDLRAFIVEVHEEGGTVKMISSHTAHVVSYPSKKRTNPTTEVNKPSTEQSSWSFNDNT